MVHPIRSGCNILIYPRYTMFSGAIYLALFYASKLQRLSFFVLLIMSLLLCLFASVFIALSCFPIFFKMTGDLSYHSKWKHKHVIAICCCGRFSFF